jgi:hypothetical protein
MATPRLTPEQIAQVSGLVFQYIAAQRQKYGSRAIPLSTQQKAAMTGFFSPMPGVAKVHSGLFVVKGCPEMAAPGHLSNAPL